MRKLVGFPLAAPLHLPVFQRRVHHDVHVRGKAQVFECARDVIAGNGLFGLLFRKIVSLGRDEGNEFDAAFDEQIACVARKGDAGAGWEDFGDNFLDGRWQSWQDELKKTDGRRGAGLPLGRDRSSLPVG